MTEQDDLLALLPTRQGHFLFESGHHGKLWLDLELLVLRPTRVRPFANELAHRLRRQNIDLVCGPLVEGAYVGLMVAEQLDIGFVYSERVPRATSNELYSVDYHLPKVHRETVRGKRIAIVNDVINAGSAVRGTYDDLVAWGANVVVVGALCVLGSWATSFACHTKIVLENLAQLTNPLWVPEECPHCAQGEPLADPAGFREQGPT